MRRTASAATHTAPLRTEWRSAGRLVDSCGRRDVGVSPEQIRRIVFVLQRNQPVVVAAVCHAYALLRVVFRRGIDIEPVGVVLQLPEGAARPLHHGCTLVGVLPMALNEEAVLRVAMPESRRIRLDPGDCAT